jgi:hypothetical protein
MLTVGTLAHTGPSPTCLRGTIRCWEWCLTRSAEFQARLRQPHGRIRVPRSLAEMPVPGIIAASLVGAAVLAPPFSGRVPSPPAESRDVAAERAAVRPLAAPRVRAALEIASDTALTCTNARKRLWTEGGWVVRRVSICR